MVKLTRRYVYDETFKAVMEWAKLTGIRSPNRKENFAFYLDEYIKSY